MRATRLVLRMKVKDVAAAAIFGLVATAGAARAEDLHFNSSAGPMDIHFGDGGQLYGHYRQPGARQPGRLDGAVSAGGVLGGYWLQPGGDHPCSHPLEGIRTWGHFTITNAWSANPESVWGYCDETPNRSWDLQRRQPAK
jgi:hypothetical protein